MIVCVIDKDVKPVAAIGRRPSARVRVSATKSRYQRTAASATIKNRHMVGVGEPDPRKRDVAIKRLSSLHWRCLLPYLCVVSGSRVAAVEEEWLAMLQRRGR